MRTSACLLSIILALPAVSQVRDDVTVELIEVPVYVTSADGHAVRGLTKDDFELRVNGRVQPVDYFDVIDFGGGQPPSAVRAPRERRLYLLLFDASYTLPAKVVRAQKAAEYALERSNPETDLFAVATYTLSKGVHFATPFVSDRTAIRRALHTLSAPADPLGLAMTGVEPAPWSASEIVNDELLHNVGDTLDEFGDLAHRLAGLEGQKHVLYFSSGFAAEVIHGGDHPVPVSHLSHRGFDAHAIGSYKRLCSAFAAAGVFVDPVDIDGIRHQPGKIAAFNSDEGLQLFSDGTGGAYVHNRNDFGPAVDDMMQAQKNVYMLAFNRSNNRAGTIDVRVKGVPRGTRVSYRQGFGKGEPAKEVDALQMADILLHDIPQNAFAIKLDASPSLLKADVEFQDGNLDALFYVFDENGVPVFGSEQRGTKHFEQPLKLAPGNYIAKVIARVDKTALLGFARAQFKVE